MTELNDLSGTATSPENTEIEDASVETSEPANDPINAAIAKAQATIEAREREPQEGDTTPLSDAARTLSQARKAKKEKSQAGAPQKDLDQSAEVKQPRADEVQAGSRPRETVPAPHFWSPENKALFSRAEPGLQKAIMGEVQKVEEWARGIAHEAKDAVSLRDSLNQLFEPYSTKFRQIGVTPVQVVDRLMAWQDDLDTNPRAAIRKLSASYNLEPQHLMGEDVYDEPYTDPRLDQALSKVQELESQLQAFTQNVQGQQVHGIQTAIERFMTETDAQGNLLHPYVSDLEAQLAYEVKKVRASNRSLSEYDVLKTAYSNVVNGIEDKFVKPKLSVVTEQAQRQEADGKRKEQARRAANASLRTNPTPGGVPQRVKPKSVDEAMELAWGQLTGT